jgi:LPXTG-site transpeptidase (sortase) family protein
MAALDAANRAEPVEREPIPPGRIHDAGVFGEDIIVHDSANGEIIIGAVASAENGILADSAALSAVIVPLAAALPSKTVSDPETIWNGETYAGNHTPIERAQMKNGSIGVLTIPKLNLSVNVYQSPDNMEAMLKGVAHFPSTSAWDSNVGLSAHNINLDGSDGYFKYLYTLVKGDSVIYQTALGERSYAVESVTVIAASDWTPLYYTDDNRLTMITCISGQDDKRLCVTAIQKAAS